jgi:hypothetical protein
MKLEFALAALILCLALVFAYFSSGAPNFFATASEQNIVLQKHDPIQTELESVSMQKVQLYSGGSSGFSTYMQNARVVKNTCPAFDMESYVSGNAVSSGFSGDAISPLSGYFATVPSDCEITLAGHPLSSFAGMELSDGWNHLGAPEQPVKATDALAGCKLGSFMLFDSKQHKYIDADTF